MRVRGLGEGLTPERQRERTESSRASGYAALKRLRTQIETLQRQQLDVVRELRSRDATWSEIGAALDMTRGAAYSRWGKVLKAEQAAEGAAEQERIRISITRALSTGRDAESSWHSATE